MKKLLLFAFCLVASLCFVTNVSANEKVKVYMFEAGGCPYCEAEVEYLEALDSYGKKFEIVRKELYVDHINWAQGKDYELGVKVANLFLEQGFKDASYQGTPFVVISNLYAAATYSTQLESYINEAYDKGDVDVVGCVEKGGENCFKGASNDYKGIVGVIIFLVVIGVVIGLMFYAKNNMAKAKEEPEKNKATKKRK